MATILVVDDERSMRDMLTMLFERDGHTVTAAKDVDSAIAALADPSALPDLVFTDLRLPGGTGLAVLQAVRAVSAEVQVILMTAFATTENAVLAMRLGAYDYQIKPVKVDELRVITAKALEKLRLIRDNRALVAQLRSKYGLSRIVGQSPRMTEVFELIEKVAPTQASVLIEGESGTGKELVARAIHEGGRKEGAPFVAINCGAIPEQLIESELFGHAAGAFTGAYKARAGLFEAAHGGTLLLDEVGELPQSMQVKLLRALQERRIRRIGEDRERSVDVRLMAATNQDLQKMVAQGTFREDLFYRLNVIRIRVPPLRERREDIPLLARAFVLRHAQEAHKAVDSLAPAALTALSQYPFPGNVRELENYMERAVMLCQGQKVTLADLPEELQRAQLPVTDVGQLNDSDLNLETALNNLEKQLIDEALRRCQGVKTQAASLLGLTFRSLRYRMQKLGYGDLYGPDP